MTAEALQEKLERDPFSPIRLRLTDGRAIEMTNPDVAFISHQSVYIFKIKRKGGKVADQSFLISLRHIVSIEDMEPAGSV